MNGESILGHIFQAHQKTKDKHDEEARESVGMTQKGWYRCLEGKALVLHSRLLTVDCRP